MAVATRHRLGGLGSLLVWQQVWQSSKRRFEDDIYAAVMAATAAVTSSTTDRTDNNHNDMNINANWQALPALLEQMPDTFAHALQIIMNARLQLNQRATFVQIGANDGITNDPLYEKLVTKPIKVKVPPQQSGSSPQKNTDLRRHWIGLQVEPQKELFDKVKALGAPADWSYFNGVVVADATTNTSNPESPPPPQCRNGTVQFCETTTPGVGDWKTQGQTNSVQLDKCLNRPDLVGQFRIVNHACASSYTSLIEQATTTLGFLRQDSTKERSLFWVRSDSPADPNTMGSSSSSFNNNKFTLDLLQIDTEGHDLAILQAFLPQVRPLCIHYEHWGALEPAILFLEENGYTVNKKPGADRLACLVTATEKKQ